MSDARDPLADALRELLGGVSVKSDAADFRAILARHGLAVGDRNTLDLAEAWLTAALECKQWSWDFDQHAAATETRDKLRAMLAAAAQEDQR